MKKNIILGGSGLVGQSFYKIIKNDKKYIFFSSNKLKNFEKFNLNSDIKKFPYKDINTCFFFSSPRILKKNFKKQIFEKEFLWVKKILQNVRINKFIYLSSSSVYYNKKHLVGDVKKKCEKYLLKNKNKFNHLQIWRPFNLVSNSYVNSHHFYNLLFKKMFIEKKKKFHFFGNSEDSRGYSNVDDFIKVLFRYSKINESFLKDYGNNDLATTNEIVKLFNKYYFRINKKFFIAEFKSDIIDKSIINNKKNSIISKKKSISVLNSYVRNSLK